MKDLHDAIYDILTAYKDDVIPKIEAIDNKKKSHAV